MDGWLEIRDTGVSVLSVLELISRGYSDRAIRKRLPSLTDKDISDAVSIAHDFILRSLVTSLLSEQPTVHRQARHANRFGKPMLSENIKREMYRLRRYGASTTAIARLFQITPGQVDSLLDEFARDG